MSSTISFSTSQFSLLSSLLYGPAPDIDDVHAATSSSDDPVTYTHGLTGVDQTQNHFFTYLLLTLVCVFFLIVCVYRAFMWILHSRRLSSATIHHSISWTWNRYSWHVWLKTHVFYKPLSAFATDTPSHARKGLVLALFPSASVSSFS
jgi:hypothetical protein